VFLLVPNSFASSFIPVSSHVEARTERRWVAADFLAHRRNRQGSSVLLCCCRCCLIVHELLAGVSRRRT
ncbi:unnamed protein product, partial [Closterium sp. NIES-53]